MNKLIGIIFSFLLLINISCNKAQDKLKQTINLKTMNEQPIYTLKVTSGNPYESYINNMVLEKDYLTGSSDSELIINDLILKSGKQKLQIVLLPNDGNKTVDKLGIDYLTLSIYRYNNGYTSYVERKSTLIYEFKLDDPHVEMPIITKEWIFNIDVPYKLKNWEHSIDLRKEDEDKLLKEVVDYYNHLANIINKGDKNSFLTIMKVRDSEVFKSLYNDAELIKEDEQYIDNRLSKSIGNIQPIKNYNIVFYGNGKIVTLEDKKGETPLFAEDKNNIYSYQIYLHRPYPNAPLEVIR